MENYKYINKILFHSQQMGHYYNVHYGRMPLDEFSKLEGSESLTAKLESRYPEAVVLLQIYGNKLPCNLVVYPSTAEKYEVASLLLKVVDNLDLRRGWHDGEI